MGDSPEAAVSKENLASEQTKEKAHEKAETVAKEKTEAPTKTKTDKEKPAKTEKQVGSGRASLTKSSPGALNAALALAQQNQKGNVLRYMPTYRMEPKNPLNKEHLENVMKAVMDKNYREDYMFHPKHSLHMAAQVSEEIKNRIKIMNFDRYRYIVLVTVGENLMQGIYSLVNFLWDADRDGFVTYTIDTPKYFATCTAFYIYYD